VGWFVLNYERRKYWERFFPTHKVLFGFVILLAAALRWDSLAVAPGWYSDEGTLLEIARNLSKGHIQYLGLNQSFLLAGRLPLFVALLALAVKLFGVKIIVLRTLTTILAIISVALVYRLILSISNDKWWAFASAFSLALYPQALLFSRLGFSYNLLAPLALFGALALWRYSTTENRRWLALASLSIGLGMVSDMVMWLYVIPLLLITGMKRWRDALWSIPFWSAPFLVYVLGMLYIAPDAFIFDWNFTMGRVSTALPIQFIYMLVNFAALWIHDPWWGIAWVGIFLVPNSRVRSFLLAFWLLPWIGMARILALGLGSYYLIPIYPLVAVGVGSALRYGLPYVERILRNTFFTWMQNLGFINKFPWKEKLVQNIVFLGTGLTLFLILTPIFWLINPYTQEGIDPLLLDSQTAQQVTSYVNQQVEADDLVVTSPTLAWAIESHVTDFQLTLVAENQPTKHFPDNVPADRFAYELRYAEAKYAVIDPVWRNWAAANIPSVADMTEIIEQEWVLEKRFDQVDVYRNPQIP